jgi:hypothetical protein
VIAINVVRAKVKVMDAVGMAIPKVMHKQQESVQATTRIRRHMANNQEVNLRRTSVHQVAMVAGQVILKDMQKHRVAAGKAAVNTYYFNI